MMFSARGAGTSARKSEVDCAYRGRAGAVGKVVWGLVRGKEGVFHFFVNCVGLTLQLSL